MVVMPDATPDPAATALAEERAILAAAVDALDQRAWRVATQIYGTLKVPALIAAVEAALKLHQPDHHKVPLCEECQAKWPCPTVRAITAALAGEGAD